jgi:hypothetical protein
MIQRYNLFWYGEGIDDNGEYVKYADHIAEVEKKVCEWVHNQSDYDGMMTGCNIHHKFYFGLEKMIYCPYCGGKIKIKD